VLHLQEFIRGPLNLLPDLVTVSRSIEKRSQDEHVKRSLEEPNPLPCLFRHRRHSTFNLRVMVAIRLSIVKGAAECGFSIDDFRATCIRRPPWKYAQAIMRQ
jgi:hypothetical protein